VSEVVLVALGFGVLFKNFQIGLEFGNLSAGM